MRPDKWVYNIYSGLMYLLDRYLTQTPIQYTIVILLFSTLLAKTSHFAEAPQAQVNRVKINLHSVGQDLTLLLSPLGTGNRVGTQQTQVSRAGMHLHSE